MYPLIAAEQRSRSQTSSGGTLVQTKTNNMSSEPFTPSADAWRRSSEPGQPPIYRTPDAAPGGASAPDAATKGSKNKVIAELQVEIDETKDILKDNIAKAAERGEHLNALHDRTETLHYQSQLFSSTAKKTRNKMWWSNKKWTIALIVLGVIIVASIIGGVVKSTKEQ